MNSNMMQWVKITDVNWHKALAADAAAVTIMALAHDCESNMMLYVLLKGEPLSPLSFYACATPNEKHEKVEALIRTLNHRNVPHEVGTIKVSYEYSAGKSE